MKVEPLCWFMFLQVYELAESHCSETLCKFTYKKGFVGRFNVCKDGDEWKPRMTYSYL